MLSRWKRASDSDVATNCGMISSHANFRYLNTPERKERFKQMRQQISQSERKVKQLQSVLERSLHLRGIQIDKNTSDRFLELMIKHSGEVSTTDTEFQNIFWEQQIKAKACKRPNGIKMASGCYYVGGASTFTTNQVVLIQLFETQEYFLYHQNIL